MNEREALIQSIRENPDDDTPRLIFADWLESTGEWIDRSRAIYIRAQCSSAQIDWTHPDKAGFQKLFAEIQDQCASRWFSALADIGYPLDELKYHRGFISSLTLPADDDDTFFADVVERVLPTEHVDLITFACPTGPVPHALRHPGIGSLGKIIVRYREAEPGPDIIEPGRGDEMISAIAAVPRRIPLRTFATIRPGLSDAAVPALASSPAFANLHTLSLDGVHLTVDGLQGFKNAVFARSINNFILKSVPAPWGAALQGVETAEVFTQGGFENLEKLEIAGYPLGDAGLLALSRSPLAKQLTSFILHADNNTDGEGVQSLFEEGAWPALKHLHVTPIHTAGEDLRRLLASGIYRTLKTFQVYFENLRPEDVEVLAANPAISGLYELMFSARRVGDVGVRSLIRSSHLKGLTRLTVSGPDINEETMMMLADPEAFPGLKMLCLTQLGHLPPEAEAALRTRYGEGFYFDIRGG